MVCMWAVCDQTRKVDIYMIGKWAKKSRIGLAFTGITSGFLAIAFTLTPSAQATPAPHTSDPTAVVRVVTPGDCTPGGTGNP